MRQQERLKKIAIIMPDVGHFFFPVILRGICDEAEKIGYNVLIYNTDNSNRKEATLLRDLTGKVRAFIIAPSTEEEGSRIYFRDLKYRGIPFVLIDRYIPNIETDYVVTDNENGAYEGVKYLINLGHKRIGHITGENSTPHLARKEGYQRALEEAEIGFDVSLVKKGKVGDDKCGYEMTREFLQMSERPTAIFAVNDWVALGAIEAIKESNLTIPEDISLLGYDDSHIVASLKVPLTTVAQPKYEIGKSAVEVLKKRFESKSGEIQKVVLKSKLVVRDSCSSPRKVQELMCHSNY